MLENLTVVLDNVYKKDCNIIIAGDLKMDMLPESNSKIRTLLTNLFREYGIEHLIKEPRRLASQPSTFIDNVCTNYGISKVVETDMSDHTYQVASFNTSVASNMRQVVSFRSFVDKNVAKFRE